MVVRFFKSVENKNSDSAVIQGKKIFALDETQNHVATLVSIQESNSTIADAQFYLVRGKIANAQKVIEKSRHIYPDNDVLKRSAIKLAELRNAEKYFSAMDNARGSAAMSDAREMTETGLSENMTPELIEYLRQYELREKAVAQKEQINTQAAMEAATQAAEKAKAADALREQENLRMHQELNQLAQKSESMRRNAGDVPFEAEDNDDVKEK
ncbi:MAG: hypothetical protein E7058_03980 [Lentisphaerae bacterium]|nr:hypothetical protein [Lentisphaerota bacterium]